MALSAGTTTWFGTGYNFYGQLGLGDTVQRTTFTQLTGNWSQVATHPSAYYNMALSAGTTKWFATGHNTYGQLGLGNSGSGTNRTTFTQLTGNWSQIICNFASQHTMAQAAGTNVWFGTGNNFSGALGLGSTGSYNTFTALTGIWNPIASVAISNTTMAFAY
jgi:alpha-tubulin suppressor-like RCC1 family protein